MAHIYTFLCADLLCDSIVQYILLPKIISTLQSINCVARQYHESFAAFRNKTFLQAKSGSPFRTTAFILFVHIRPLPVPIWNTSLSIPVLSFALFKNVICADMNHVHKKVNGTVQTRESLSNYRLSVLTIKKVYIQLVS